MAEKIKFIELNYYHHDEFNDAAEVMAKHLPSNLFARHLQDRAAIILVKHGDLENSLDENGIHYQFFKGKNSFFYIPSATHKYIKAQKPGMVLVQGLIFPFQVMALRRKLGKHCKIVCQHQGELPFRRKKIFQKIADRSIDGYIFTSLGIADEWIEAGIIKDREKCFEINPSSTLFVKQDKSISKQKLGMQAQVNFLWVGRLNENKDPITVLKAFEKYFTGQPSHTLYMIFSEDDMLEDVKRMIDANPVLQSRVELVGRIANTALETWYSAADYFVSGSHREGGSYALTEAMACGCIPIVTNIPAAMKAIDDGKAGYYYTAGDSDGLYDVLKKLDHPTIDKMSAVVNNHFANNFSGKAIADKMFEVFEKLSRR